MAVELPKKFPALLALGLLAGCVTPPVPPTVVTDGMPNAELALRRALDQVNGDMAQIGAMRPEGVQPGLTQPGPTPLAPTPVGFASTPGSAAEATPVVAAELQRPAQFIWTGPLDAGVQKLAASIGYSVSVVAPPNPQPVAVAVNINGQVLDAFQALGEQAGTVATVQVDPLHRHVEVVHHV